MRRPAPSQRRPAPASTTVVMALCIAGLALTGGMLSFLATQSPAMTPHSGDVSAPRGVGGMGAIRPIDERPAPIREDVTREASQRAEAEGRSANNGRRHQQISAR